MPFVHVTWLPKEVATAIIKAITNNEVAKAAEIPTENVVVRFSEAIPNNPIIGCSMCPQRVDGFGLPPGHTHESLGLSNDRSDDK
ncbi:hypothetical protein ACHAXT_008779 [Thalassiosira profunda]